MISTALTSAASSAPALYVNSAGLAAVNGAFFLREPSIVPVGFARTCIEMKWDVDETWRRLSYPDKRWYEAENDSYIYFNRLDSNWWLDGPDGAGAYIVPGDLHSPPPLSGWASLRGVPKPDPILTLV
eukprot:CAMPEP_0182472072 /NCGR_PEP_ID=MMETSP1319-20130603/21487_1 /TAXON_ID=172717 /ORGANISM="Bolidomonas pacifica, Strain RCC208" /LENGTH=127 /DNA_ID=CAMNT_0024672701 /DNA_START=116 /DNA_END=496 /DNA_ORIENTATION=-